MAISFACLIPAGTAWADPDSTVLTSGWYNPATWAGIRGTATASGGQTLTFVDITIQRTSDNLYWKASDGTWVVPQAWLRVTGTASWWYDYIPADDGVNYTVQSRATDTGGVETTYGLAVFAYDAGLPMSTITTSGYHTERTYTGSLEGTAADAASGVFRVDVTVQRADDGRYWNGSTWVSSEVWLPARGTMHWTLTLPASYDWDVNLQSRAVDTAGNVQVPVASGRLTMPPEGSTSKGLCALSAPAIPVRSGAMLLLVLALTVLLSLRSPLRS